MKELPSAASREIIQRLLNSDHVSLADKKEVVRLTVAFQRDKLSPERLAEARQRLERFEWLRKHGLPRPPIDECWAALLDFDGDLF